MRLTTICQTLAIATLSQALIIPADITADGIYQVVNRADGVEVHTKIANITDNASTSLTETHVLDRRYSGQIWCGCGYYVDHGNCDAAVADITNQLSNGQVQPGLSFYSIRGNVVAFACNRGSQTFPQFSGFGSSAQYITNYCGQYVAGSTQLADTILGYMQYQNGLDFCAASTNSPVGQC